MIAMDGARTLSCLLIALAASSVLAQRSDPRDSASSPWLLGGFFGQSIPILGSDEVRTGGGLFLEYEKTRPKIRFLRGVDSLVYEAYFETTWGGPKGGPSAEHEHLNNVGVMALARWRRPLNSHGQGMFVDLGWGLTFGDRSTVDLDSHINSTPVLDFGVAFGPKERELLVGIRYLHISDAGIKGRNQGQNQFHLFVAKRL